MMSFVTRLRRFGVFVLLVAVSGLVGGAAPAASRVLTPEPVKHSRWQEDDPAADGAWFGWSVHQKGRGAAYFVQRGTHPRQRVADWEPYQRGFIDGAGISGTRLVYARYRPGSYDQDIYRYNLRTRHLSRLGGPVNTDKDEYDPSLSGRHLLFLRSWFDGSQSQYRLLLFDQRTRQITRLASGGAYRMICGPFNPRLNGDYAVWRYHCDFPERHRIVVYHIPTATRTYLQHTDGVPAVSADGTVYLARYSTDDGSSQIVKWFPDGSTEVLLTTERYIETLTVDDRATSRVIYYTVQGEVSGDWDIFKLVDPTPPDLP